MPIKIPDNLPATDVLTAENIFYIKQDRAYHQDIRHLKIAILNLNSEKAETETQLLRLLGNSALQVEIVLLYLEDQGFKKSHQDHLDKFYKRFDDVKDEMFDGLIITDSPVENLEFSDVPIWNELTKVFKWSIQNVFSTFYIGWAATAALSYHYGIEKYPLKNKLFGVFAHNISKRNEKLLRGFDDLFYVPHSRQTGLERAVIEIDPRLEILAESQDAGVYIIQSLENRQIFVTGHPEYDALSLKAEYDRDLQQVTSARIPENYFPDDDPGKQPKATWKCHANLLFSNWLNYYVYQETPYDLSELMYYI